MIDEALLRRGLFLLDSEPSHHAALNLLRTAGAFPGGLALLHARFAPTGVQPVKLAGLTFPHRVGLAAGYDKNAVAWKALAALGLGHVEVGTVTPEPQPGNPAPRIFRLSSDRALINRLGFPSEGAAAVRRRLSAQRPYGCVLGVNLGRNKTTPNAQAARDYTALVEVFADVADYLTVNVSSPNTPELRALQTGEALRGLLRAVVDARDAQAVARPVFVKLAPDLSEDALKDALEAVKHTGIDGVIATNTTLGREGLTDAQACEAGGLSGAPLTARALTVLESIRRLAGPSLPLISVGGIMSAADAKARFDAGADLIQLFTGMVYEGPSLIARTAQVAAESRPAQNPG